MTRAVTSFDHLYDGLATAERRRVERLYLDGRIELPEFERLDAGVDYRVRQQIEAWNRRQTRESWSSIRRRVWERSPHECAVCETALAEDAWECGHKVDRMCGGSDLDENLAPVCGWCNIMKPMHETIAEYEAWRAQGSPLLRITLPS